MHDANVEDNRPEAARAVRQLVTVGTIVSAVAVTAFLAFDKDRAGERSFWVLVAAPTIAIALAAVVLSGPRSAVWEQLKPKGGDFSLGFFAAGGLFAATYGFVQLVLPDGSPRHIWLMRAYLQTGDPSPLRAHPVAVFAGIIAFAAAQEVVWRGLVTSILAERIGSRFGWLVSAVLYAAALLPTMWALKAPDGLNPILPIAGLGMGIAWGAIVRKVDRLVPVIVAHALYGWATLVIFRLWGESL